MLLLLSQCGWGRGWQRALGWGEVGAALAQLPGVRSRLAERLMEFCFLSLPSMLTFHSTTVRVGGVEPRHPDSKSDACWLPLSPGFWAWACVNSHPSLPSTPAPPVLPVSCWIGLPCVLEGTQGSICCLCKLRQTTPPSGASICFPAKWS